MSRPAQPGPAAAKKDDGAQTPDMGARDDASIYSRHALKVFRGSSYKSSSSDSPTDSTFSMPGSGRRANGSGPAGMAGVPQTDEERAEYKRFRNKTLLRAAIQFTILLVVCSALLAGTLYFVLPPIDDKDRPAVKIPRSFDQLKALNAVLQRYKDEYFFRVMFCWIVIYMFLQAFSIPGSMYMSIIAGAMWGVPLALPIVCAAVATGATICYLISANLGAVLVAMPKWKARVDAWGEVLAQHNDNMLSYLIVIRMMPLPPHNVVNILAPHLGIGLPIFWLSTFLGIFAVSTIHVTIGEKLDQMTSADDFHLFSVRNVLLLGGVITAVLIPVAVRKYSAAAQTPLEEQVDARGGRVRLPDNDDDALSDDGPVRNAFDSDDDGDELPPRARLQGASRHSYRARNGDNDYDDDEESEEGRAAYVARAWRGVEVDADQHSDGDADSHAGGLSDGEGSLPVFEDRREQGRHQQSAKGRRGGRAGSNKARRVLGMNGNSSRAIQGNQQSYLGQISGWASSALGRKQ